MTRLIFEWHPAKAAQNEADLAVSFEAARAVFDDPFALEWLDDREDYGEDQYIVIGMVDERLLYLVYTMRGDAIRIISARGAEPHERRRYHEEEAGRRDWRRFDAMSERERHTAAVRDRDAKPLSSVDFERMPRTPQVKIIRRALGLTQEEFAHTFQIPLGTLRDWEQGAAVPDQSAKAYLRVIARNPDAVREALAIS
jgi:putative transcriptional regulator